MMLEPKYKGMKDLDLRFESDRDRILDRAPSIDPRDEVDFGISEKFDNPPMPKAAIEDIAPDPAPVKIEEDEDSFLSSRVLMVQGQQIMCQEMQTELRNGAAWLAGLEERSKMISSYLASAEVEFSKLEAQTKLSEELVDQIEDLRAEHAGALATIDEQRQEIALLEAAKAEFHAQLEPIRSENIRLQEYKRVQNAESGRHKAQLMRVESENQKLMEKIRLLENEKAKLVHTKTDLENQLAESAANVTEAAKESGSLSARIRELEGTVEHRTEDLQLIRDQHSKLKAKFNEWQMTLKDQSHEADMKKRELEQLLRLKEKRIAELEGLRSDNELQDEMVDAVEEGAKPSKSKAPKGAGKPKTKAA